MRVSYVLGAAAAALVLSCAPTAGAAEKKLQPLNQYTVTGGDREKLAAQGFDLTEGRSGEGGGQGIVATPEQAESLRAQGFTVKAPYGEMTKSFAPPNPFPTTKLGYGWDVYRPWRLTPGDCPNTCSGATDGNGNPVNLKTWYEAQRTQHPDLVRKVTYGTSRYGEPLVAYRVTTGANSSGDATKPVVFYDSTQHAREWLATELERRLFQYVLAHSDDPASGIPEILRNVELWFVPVVNVDGYDYTYLSKGTRLWRKTLADNNGDDQITNVDGVDTNRNFAEKWRYDEEGAHDDFQPDDYRGPSPESEPETKAIDTLMGRLRPKFLLDYHTYGPLILWPEGWQVATDSTDAPPMKVLAGTPTEPGIDGYFPEVSAALYITNGDITDHAYKRYGTLAYTVEANPGSGPDVGGTQNNDNAFSPGGFVFQDWERDVQAEFNKNRDFALDLARSALDPGHPDSHLNNVVRNFVIDPFSQSYGSPQTVEVNVNRALSGGRVNWSVNDGATHSAALSEYQGGTKYGEPGVYYHKLRGQVTGFNAGDQVRVWFTAGGQSSSAFTFRAVNQTAGDVLVLSAEDYSGNSSVTGAGPRPGPEYLDYYRDALQRLGVKYDVYDIDAQNRTAPDYFGVLSHYKAIVWYTGDDLYVREPGQPGATGASKVLQETILNVRDYINDGGKVLVTGQNALQGSWDEFAYNPLGSPPVYSYCNANATDQSEVVNVPPGQSDPCQPTSNDFIQYYLGAYIPIVAASGDDVADLVFNRAGGVFGTTAFSVNGADSADNQATLTSFVPTSDILPPAVFPQFASTSSVTKPGKPAYDPFAGTHYAYAKSSDESYQRLRRTVDLTSVPNAHLKFQMSYDTESTFDYVFVEAHTVGQDDWTTLPDSGGQTTDDVGESCDIDWNTIHPFLDHYQSNPTPAADCTNHGSIGTPPGAWNGATGNSSGWHQWDVDLSAYAGKQVEISITYAQDFASAGLGVFLDEAQVTGVDATPEGFETGLGAWTAGPPPAGTENQAGWVSSTSVGFTDGPGVATKQTELWGFGLEAVRGADKRAALLGDALHYLAGNDIQIPPLQPVAQPDDTPAVVAPSTASTAVVTAAGIADVAQAPRFVLTKRYKADRKGQVKVRVSCTSSVTCKGKVRLLQSRSVLAARSYTIKAGKTATVTLKLKKSAFKHLKKVNRQRLTLRLLTGSAKVVKSSTITLREP
jgi:Zinc carboxypeptidase/Immune inhibitor A-like, MAM domain